MADGRWFDAKISVNNLIWLIGVFIGLGVVWARFEAVESDLNQLIEDEVYVAKTEQVVEIRNYLQLEITTLSERLDKKIQILNEKEDEIHELELKVLELETRFNERGGR
ncbi:MAG: hypothetical protein VW683_00160 [Betaproteobacteria bacterium]|jgi:hypothetical protein